MMALDPTKNRVYSEPGPPAYAMQICAGEGCTGCSVESAANLLKDVVYMMGRSNDPKEENLFFIIQPEATLTIWRHLEQYFQQLHRYFCIDIL